jgi:hypothetical protein
MMLDSPEELLSALLLGTVEELDIPPDLYRLAVARYQDVGQWLSWHAGSGPAWDIYPQGSFRLGTVVRPLVRNGEYDIDLVCLRHVAKESTTQEQLKADVGSTLTAYVRHRAPKGPTGPSAGKRCWTLAYPGFHMDVLPSIPDPEGSRSGILITDREVRFWQPSDPIGYSAWFRGRMAIEFAQKRAELAVQKAAKVEDIPEWEVKTTLQRAVQVFKCHRDLYFAHDLDNRPPSIILTTLAAHAYRGAGDLFTCVLDIAGRMSEYIEETAAGWRVENPVQRAENFADRWATAPSRAKKFFAWLGDLERDLDEAARGGGLDNVVASLSASFGEEPVRKAATRVGHTALSDRQTGVLKMVAGTGMLGRTTGTRVPRHDFFGEEPANQ